MNASSSTAYEWKDLPWKKFQQATFKLQKRIYQASQRGDTRKTRSLQKLLIKSQAATYLAVRRVTQDNHGKKTAGVDGVKKLTPPQRLTLAAKIKAQPYQTKAKPVRRIWIPKPGKEEKRALGIPTLEERARQALLKAALEPEWEARFEPNSYGFRPGRSAHDAISYLFVCIWNCPKYVLDADIAKCFDKINHRALLEKVNTYPQMRRTIQAWLEAGILDGHELFSSTEGTPQGGVISPLLMNITLHGLETFLQSKFPKHPRIPGTDLRLNWQPKVARYADDLVILHPDPQVIEQAQGYVVEWLQPLGLELKQAKTRITHTLWYGTETPGFDFLGFNLRQYRVTKNRKPNSNHGRLDFVTRIKPSQKALEQQHRKIHGTLNQMRSCHQTDLIAILNPIIVGWGRYYGICDPKSKQKLDDRLLYHALRRWARRRHLNQSWGKVARKYWRLETGQWTFSTPKGTPLQSHYQKIGRLKGPLGTRSPFDGDWAYWLNRCQTSLVLTTTKAKLFRKQKGKCAYCGLYFQPGDVLETDHILPRTLGGSDHLKNKQLLHRHCHDEKTLLDKSNGRGINCH